MKLIEKDNYTIYRPLAGKLLRIKGDSRPYEEVTLKKGSQKRLEEIDATLANVSEWVPIVDSRSVSNSVSTDVPILTNDSSELSDTPESQQTAEVEPELPLIPFYSDSQPTVEPELTEEDVEKEDAEAVSEPIKEALEEEGIEETSELDEAPTEEFVEESQPSLEPEEIVSESDEELVDSENEPEEELAPLDELEEKEPEFESFEETESDQIEEPAKEELPEDIGSFEEVPGIDSAIAEELSNSEEVR